MLVVGIFVGAFISASLSGDLRAEWVPAKWSAAFGNSAFLRWGASLVGES